jgi:acetolactate synthase I/III small subunit
MVVERLQVRCTAAQRAELKNLVDIFKGSVTHLTPQSMTIEIIGTEDTMTSLQDLLLSYGILEVARTGRIALPRESKVDSALLQTAQLSRNV